MTTTLEPTEKARLRRFLADRFSLDDLENLAFDLGVDHELFSHKKQGLSRELIEYFERRDRLSCLVTEVLKQRRDNELVQLLAKLPAYLPSTKIQIIVSADLLEDVSGLLGELATRLNVTSDQVVLIGAAQGSMRLLVGLPENVADLRILTEIRSLGNEKYRVDSTVSFDSLDLITQKAWRLIARDYPPNREGNTLRPTVSWRDGLEAATKAQSFSDSTPPGQSDLVLVVDDDRDWRDRLEDWVSELHLGYGCVATSDPEAGREAIYKLRPTTLVLDLKLQAAADGNFFLGWLLAEQAMFYDVPTLIVTGYAVEAASTASQYEVVAFFDKGTVTKKAFQDGLVRARQATLRKKRPRGRKKLEMIQSARTSAAKVMRTSIPDIASIRWLLRKAFNDEELTTFCYDHFRPVSEKFTTGMSQGEKVQLLIEHCERHEEIKKLLRLVKECNPAKFAEFESLPGSDSTW
jgi:FixJ family two-component response regulator